MPRLFGILFLLASGAAAREPANLADDLDKLAEDAHRAWNVPGCAVAVVKDGKTVVLKGYGVKQVGKDDAVTADTIFGIGSLTKAVAATALAKLVEDGKLRWDDPVRKHLPWFRLKDELADRDATIRDFLCHRSGLARHDLLWHGAPWSLEDSVKRMAFLEPELPFRSGFLYCNLTYVALGMVMDEVAGKSWDKYVLEDLFRPIGMKGAGFSCADALKSPDHATPHRGEPGGGKPTPIDWYDDDKQVRASGSVKAGVRDLERWLRFHLGDGTIDGKAIVKRDILRETYEPQVVTPVNALLAREADTAMSSYALGWRVRDHRGRLVREHGGTVDGFRAHILVAPKDGVGVVVLANLHGTSLPPMLSYAILDRLLSLKPRDWNAAGLGLLKREREFEKKRDEAWKALRIAGTKPPRELDALAGEYGHPAYGTVTIKRIVGGLRLSWSSYDVALEHFHHGTFVCKLSSRIGGSSATFALDAEGEVATLRFQGQEFVRKGSRR